MNKIIFYGKVLLPNLIFLSVYLLFLINRDLFSASTNAFSWLGYSFSVLFLVGVSVYLNRPHRIRINYEDKEACLGNIRAMFYRKGYKLKGGKSNRLYFNKAFVRSSVLTPAITVYFRTDHFIVEGPKVKVDDVAEWFEETEAPDVEVVEIEHRLAS